LPENGVLTLGTTPTNWKGDAVCTHVDIYLNGHCKTCDREAQAKYRQRRKAGMALLHAAESRGLTGAEAVALLQAIDGRTIRGVMGQ
jgi:hypothetical protein